MTKLWRPEGWRSSYRVVTTTLSDETNKTRFLENRAYEAGADAMLKALAPHLSSFYTIGEQIRQAIKNKNGK